MSQRLPTFMPTKEQREWIEKEKVRTGNSFAVILKGLIQKEIDNEYK
jgi:hypothetical protein